MTPVAGGAAGSVGNYSGEDGRASVSRTTSEEAEDTQTADDSESAEDEEEDEPSDDADDEASSESEPEEAPAGDEEIPAGTQMRNASEAAETAAEAAADAEAEAEAEAEGMDAYVVRDPSCLGKPDIDGDGLCAELEAKYGTDPNIRDTDGDGLGDGMEVKGYRIRLTRKRITLAGANPLHRDVYVEIDYTPGYRPTDAAMEDVRQAFANSPVMNVDGTKGVTLHAEIDDTPLKVQKTYDNVAYPEDYLTIKKDNFELARSAAYHYALFAKQYNGSGSSGVADFGGVDLMVTLGTKGFDNSQQEQAATFMHELGHNLGLTHGGLLEGKKPDDTNFKPNYLSIMSYTYQFLGVPTIDGSNSLDYSRATVGALSETALSEIAGLGVTGSDNDALAQYGSPLICTEQVVGPFEDCNAFYHVPGNVASRNLDFNFNFCIDSGTVQADLNGLNGTGDTFPKVLADWFNLDYSGKLIIGDLKRINARVRTVETPITCAHAHTLETVSRVVVDTQDPPMCNPSPSAE